MTFRRALLALLVLTAAIAAGWWWLEERGDPGPAPARRDEAKPTPGAELTGRAAEGTAPAAPSTATTPPARVPTWRLEGRVTAKGGAGVAGAVVDVTLRRGEIQTLVGSAVADREGNYAIDLASARALGAFALAGTALRVLAHADGFKPEEAHRGEDAWPKEQAKDVVVRQDLELGEGDVLRGRVVRADGTPVADALVAFCDGMKAESFAQTLPDGRYRIAHPDLVEGFVVALAHDVGTGRVPAGRERTLPDLVLEPGPSVEGSVVYADGKPVAGLAMTGEVQGNRDPCFSGAWWQGIARSRADGTFRILLPAVGACSISTDATSEPVKCRTGDRDVKIVVRAHRLRVHLVDGDGRPLPGLSMSAEGWDAANASVLDDLLAGRTTPEEARRRADYSSAGNVSEADATQDYFSFPGSAWAFHADAPGSLPAEVVLRTPSEGNETDVRIVIRTLTGGGRLRVRATDPDGKPVPLLLVEVQTPLGSYLFHGPVAADAAPIGPFPAGTIRVTGQPIQNPKDSGDVPPADAWLLSAEAIASARDGASADVVLRPVWGGRVRVTLRPPGGAAAGGGSYGVRAVPVEGGAPVLLMGEVPGQDGLYSSEWSAGGPTYVPTLLAPGVNRLEVSAGNGWGQLAAQGLVTIRPREITDVTLDLAAR